MDATANSDTCALRGQHRGSPGYPPGEVSAHAEYLDADAAAVAHLRRAGLYDDYSALTDLEASLSMSLDGMLASESPLLRGLAVVDRRFGKRRLRQYDPESSEHALVRELLDLRRATEARPDPRAAV